MATLRPLYFRGKGPRVPLYMVLVLTLWCGTCGILNAVRSFAGGFPFFLVLQCIKTHHCTQKPMAKAWDTSRASALHMGGSRASESAPQAVCHSGMHDGL